MNKKENHQENHKLSQFLNYKVSLIDLLIIEFWQIVVFIVMLIAIYN